MRIKSVFTLIMASEPTPRTARSEGHIRETRSLFGLITLGIFVAGIWLAKMGNDLVHLGSIGQTKIYFFGQSFDSSNVGVAAIFLGAASIVIVLTRLMKRVKEVAALPKGK